jgi:hypothetical protein
MPHNKTPERVDTMFELLVADWGLYFDRHSIPVRGLFRVERNAKGEIFVDIGRCFIILTNHRKNREYYLTQPEKYHDEGQFNADR